VNTVLSKNPGYQELKMVVAVMSGDSTTMIYFDLSLADIVKLVTSSHVECSFNQHKCGLRGNRRFAFQHLKEMFVTYSYDNRHFY
jgi:hypothetical protein